MCKLSAIIACLILGLSAQAQETPRVEVFGGYSLDRASIPLKSTVFPDLKSKQGNLHGWNASATVNANRWLGVVADFGGHYGSPIVARDVLILPPSCFIGCSFTISTTLHSVHTFTFGPRISQREGRRTIFAQALFGGARTREDLSPQTIFGGSPGGTITETSFAMILDGGADIGLSRHFAVRVQPGYLMTHMLDKRQNNFRFSTGVVWKFGD